jgi:hypothetical protein
MEIYDYPVHEMMTVISGPVQPPPRVAQPSYVGFLD